MARRLAYVQDRLWMNQAMCGRHPDLPWTAERCPDLSSLLVMQDICVNQCPVLFQCAQFALHGRGVDGGFYAGVWMPWMTQDGRAAVKTARERARRSLKGTVKARRPA
jgi:hypothetical protein